MLFVVAVVLTITGMFFTYIAVGLVRASERKRGFLECEERLRLLRGQLRRRRA
jgi:hypothetical protein